MARTVFFDADDTLWDEQGVLQTLERRVEETLDAGMGTPSNFRAVFSAVEERNIPALGYGISSYMFSLGMAIVAHPEWAAQLPTVLPIVRAVGDAFYRETPKVFPGVHAALRQLKERGYRIGVLTRGQESEQLGKLDRSGLTPLFDLVRVVPRKNRDTYSSIARDLGGGSPPCMIGNSMRSDIEPAHQAGWHTIMVPAASDWWHDKAANAGLIPTTVVTSIAEAVDTVLDDGFWLSGVGLCDGNTKDLADLRPASRPDRRQDEIDRVAG